jgi:hypothetical protein
MSFIIGKITRKVSKQHNEYFVGKICNLPVRGSWAKKGQDDLCLFLDLEKINFLAKENKPAAEAGAQEETKQ